MYDPKTCTEDDCTRAPEPSAGGMCLRHLFRWALRCTHDGDTLHEANAA